MKLRIGMSGDFYWIEAKSFLIWRKLSSFSDYRFYEGFLYDKEHTKYYHTFEECMEESAKFNAVLNKKSAVYTEV